jgi:hypothetical protein
MTQAERGNVTRAEKEKKTDRFDQLLHASERKNKGLHGPWAIGEEFFDSTERLG